MCAVDARAKSTSSGGANAIEGAKGNPKPKSSAADRGGLSRRGKPTQASSPTEPSPPVSTEPSVRPSSDPGAIQERGAVVAFSRLEAQCIGYTVRPAHSRRYVFRAAAAAATAAEGQGQGQDQDQGQGQRGGGSQRWYDEFGGERLRHAAATQRPGRCGARRAEATGGGHGRGSEDTQPQAGQGTRRYDPASIDGPSGVPSADVARIGRVWVCSG